MVVAAVALGPVVAADHQAFIQSLENRPNPHPPEADAIPTVDISLVNSPELPNPEALQKLAIEVGQACEKWGFFQVINHGVPPEVRGRMDRAARDFFGLDKEEKIRVLRDGFNPFGYYDTEHTKNVRDWKEVFDFVGKEPMTIPASIDGDEVKELFNQWPTNPNQMREVCEEYEGEMQKLALKLLELIALSLGLAKDRFACFFKDDQTSFIRLNHYPPCPISDLALGVGRHKDGGALTILAQDEVGGLQVKRKSDGEWLLVKPNPNAFIINVGDIIQVWSNDKYESVEHRVKVNSEKERFSIPFFLNPAYYTIVEPLEEFVSEENPAKYNAYDWGKFFASRKNSNYKKLDVENVQIDHFKKGD